MSEHGAEASSIQSVSRACTVPSWRCRTAPKDLKMAPCRMSVPIATVGLNPKRKTSIGVISEPPPMPVMPTRRPMSSPAMASFGSIAALYRAYGSDMTVLCKNGCMLRAADPYRDTSVIDSRAPRFNQAVIGILALVAVTVGPWWLLAVLAAQLVVGLTLGRRYCLPCLAYFELVQPRF